MGDYRITIDGVGNHGCGRGTEAPEVMGEKAGHVKVDRCGSSSCVDCIAVEFAEKLKAAGGPVYSAKLEHWPAAMLVPPGCTGPNGELAGARTPRKPGDEGPVDDLLDGTRTKPF